MSVTPEAIPRFPLAWPVGWKRTPPGRRQRSSFSTTRTDVVNGSVRKRIVDVTIYAAVQRLQKEIDRLGGSSPTLSTNVPPRLDGWPVSSATQPSDPGVACYFLFRAKAIVLACDKYRTVAENIAAIAAHIDALRRIERYGVGTIEQALAGYRALPADTAADWRTVFGFQADERVTVAQLDTRFRERARVSHPDVGGSEIEMAHIIRARDFALSEVAP